MTSKNTKATAIKVDGVSKDFKLPHEKNSSIKGIFTGSISKKSSRMVETQHALKDISFEIKAGEFFGIVGRNGSGKSTLLKILAGIYQPTSGKVHTRGKLVPFIELGVGFNPELTGRENVFLNGAMLGFSRKELEVMYDDIVEFAELEEFMDKKLKNYSSGMQVRLAFAMATRSEADILLVDEVLAVGDAEFQRKCFKYFRQLKRMKKTVVFVSHDMDAVRRFCDRAVLIEQSKIILTGGPEQVAKNYTKLFTKEAAAENKKVTDDDKRSGDGSVSYKNIKLDVNDETILIRAEIEALQNTETPIYGFYVANVNRQILFGKNSMMYEQSGRKELQKNDVETITWEFPKIFNEGEYYISIGASYPDGHYGDLWEDAASFSIITERSNPFLVNPEVNFQTSINEQAVKTSKRGVE